MVYYPATLPYTPGAPLVGHLFQAMRRGIFPLVREHWLRHRDAFSIRVGPVQLATFIHPDAVERILLTQRPDFIKGSSYDIIRSLLGDSVVTVEGARWKRQRQTIQPCMNRSFLEDFCEPMVRATADMVEDWAARGVRVLDIYPEMIRLTLRNLGNTLFGVDLGANSLSIQTFAATLEELSRRGNNIVGLPLSWPTPSNLRLRRAVHQLDEFIYALLDARIAARESASFFGSRKSADLIALLLDQGQPLDRKLARDELITMFFAGHETTALALTWTWYLLAMHPGVERRLHDELDRALGGRLPTAADLPRLQYTAQVIQESMRLLPPIWNGSREAARDTELCGYALPRGTIVMMTPYFTHRHPDFWADPEAFQPDRFEPARARRRHKYAYYPFSAGPRLCMGKHFAMMEAQLVMAVVAQRYRFDLRPGYPVEAAYQITLRPRHGIHMIVRRRA